MSPEELQREAQSRWDSEVGVELESNQVPHNPQFSYDLGPESVVVDVGGCRGDWTAEIVRRYDPRVLVFEPVQEFYDRLVERFSDNPKVTVRYCALSDASGPYFIKVDGVRSRAGQGGELVTQLDVKDAGLPTSIDLLSMNIEGAEYPLLSRMIETGLAARCRNLQVQFHSFVHDAEPRRQTLRTRLAETHEEYYCYSFIWEGWRLK